ncbi:MAG: hypothetical protein ACOC6E_00100 [Thermodesulfobacteriota bacterium]
MRRFTLQMVLIALLASFCLGGYFTAQHILKLPFRSTNDVLHQRDTGLTLDFLIPAGTHIDEKMTIGDVLQIRFKKEKSIYTRVLRAISGLIPPKYRIIADLILFFFWCFTFMVLFRIFSFMGYARSLRVSLLFGGITYYFMPDFSPGKIDDLIFLAGAILIIGIKLFLLRSRKKEKK